MKHLLCLLVVHINLTVSYACSCAHPPQTFMASLQSFTAEVEVVEIDTVQQAKFPEKHLIFFTKLKVIKVFNGQKSLDYVWMDNRTGTDCTRGLFPDSLGQRYIITARVIKEEVYLPWYWDHKGRNFLFVSTCGKMVLDVKGDTVIGVITKSNEKEIHKRYQKLKKQDPAKATAFMENIYLTKYHKDLVQFIPKEEFYQIMAEIDSQ